MLFSPLPWWHLQNWLSCYLVKSRRFSPCEINKGFTFQGSFLWGFTVRIQRDLHLTPERCRSSGPAGRTLENSREAGSGAPHDGASLVCRGGVPCPHLPPRRACTSLSPLCPISSLPCQHPQAEGECFSRTPDAQGEGAGNRAQGLARLWREVRRGTGQNGQSEWAAALTSQVVGRGAVHSNRCLRISCF